MRNVNWTSRPAVRILVLLVLVCLVLICFHADVLALSDNIREDKTIDYESDALDRCSTSSAAKTNCIVLYTQATGLEDRRQMHYKHRLLLQNEEDAFSMPTVYINISRFVHPTPPRTKAETLFISLATSAKRVLDPQAVLYTWMPGSKVHFLLTLPFNDPAGIEDEVMQALSSLGLSSYHVQRDEANFYGDAWSGSLPKMVQIAKAAKTRITHYILMDDDTMITSLVNYRHMLDEHSPEIQRVIGSPSEIIFQAGAETGGGSGGYGGASVVLTRSLAENVAKNWDEAATIRYTHRAGDCMLSGAIGYVQGRPMRSPNIYYERALHQNDISNPGSSLIKGGFRWLTFHHWNWFDIYPGVEKTTQLARVAELTSLLNSENLFQNHLLRQDQNETVILTTGCCITTYRPPLNDDDLYRLEAVGDGEYTGRFSVMNSDATHGKLRPYRREGVNKTTAWYTGIRQDANAGESYTISYETAALDRTQVIWVVT